MGNQRILLNDRQHALMIGTLLGDGTLEKNGRNYRLRIEHGEAQRAYIEWKANELRPLSLKLRLSISWHKQRGKFYRKLHLSTITHEGLNEYARLFYPRGRKSIPAMMTDLLKSPFSLAVWYMDDGYKRSDCNALRLNTDCSHSLIR